MSERNEQGLLYNDDAHRDAWAGLKHMGIWDFKIPPDMVGKSFGEAIKELLIAEGVPRVDGNPARNWEATPYTVSEPGFESLIDAGTGGNENAKEEDHAGSGQAH